MKVFFGLALLVAVATAYPVDFFDSDEDDDGLYGGGGFGGGHFGSDSDSIESYGESPFGDHLGFRGLFGAFQAPVKTFMDTVGGEEATTEVVNGYKITRTVKTYNRNGILIRLQVVKITPVDEDDDHVEKEKPTEVSVEATEEPEVTPEKPDSNGQPNDLSGSKEETEDWDRADANAEVEVFDHEGAAGHDTERWVDLSGDTRINDIMADDWQQQQRLMEIPRDVELFETD